MRRRWYTVFGAILLAGVLTYLLISPSFEPSYGGRSLGEWLDSDYRRTNGPISPDFSNAIIQMGTNVVPYLVNYIRYEHPSWKSSTAGYLYTNYPNSRLALYVRHWLQKPYGRQFSGAHAFLFLQPHADFAAPLVIKCMDRPKCAAYVAMALSDLGEKGGPYIADVLTNCNDECVRPFTRAFYFTGTNGAPIIAALVHNIQSTNALLAAESVYALERCRPRELVIPTLQNLMKDPRPDIRRAAVFALANSGAQARPIVIQCANDSDPGVRVAISNVLSNPFWFR